MNSLTIGALLLTSGGSLGAALGDFALFGVPQQERSIVSRRFGNVYILLSMLADIAGIALLIFSLGWLAGLGYWALTALVSILVAMCVVRRGLDSLVMLVGFGLVISGSALVYAGMFAG